AVNGVAYVGMADIEPADRLALDLVAFKEAGAAPAGEHRGQFPAEVDRIAEAGIESESGGGMIEVGRISGEENASDAIGVGHDVAGDPTSYRDEFMRYLFADHFQEQALRINLIRRVVELLPAYAEAVEFASIEDDEVAPQPGWLDEVDQCRLAHRVVGPQ